MNVAGIVLVALFLLVLTVSYAVLTRERRVYRAEVARRETEMRDALRDAHEALHDAHEELARKRDGIGALERRMVVVHTKDDRSIRGVMVASHDDCIVIGSAAYLGDPVTPLGGDVIVPRASVSWLQRLDGEGAS